MVRCADSVLIVLCVRTVVSGAGVLCVLGLSILLCTSSGLLLLLVIVCRAVIISSLIVPLLLWLLRMLWRLRWRRCSWLKRWRKGWLERRRIVVRRAGNLLRPRLCVELLLRWRLTVLLTIVPVPILRLIVCAVFQLLNMLPLFIAVIRCLVILSTPILLLIVSFASASSASAAAAAIGIIATLVPRLLLLLLLVWLASIRVVSAGRHILRMYKCILGVDRRLHKS